MKKNKIFESVLEGSKEPTEGKVDVAIIAHQILKFGNERDAKFDKLLNAQRANSESKWGTGSVRK